MEKTDFLKTGLTSVEAQKRLQQFGKNELVAKKDYSALGTFISQFRSPLIYILLAAGLITLFLRNYSDSAVIFFAILVNTTLGFYQETKAQKTLAALKNLLVPTAKIIRDGKQIEIPAIQIVPGDLVVLTMGHHVPADGILIEATDFSVNEAVLTGESMPVSKYEVRSKKYEEVILEKASQNQKENQVFMGTTVVTGIAKMIVTNTGMNTEIGKIGKQVEKIKKELTPLQIQLNQLAKTLALVIGIIIFLVFLLGSLRGYPILEIFMVSVALAVASIPEGLVVTLTVILTLGMQRIVKKKAVVRKLLAAETLGSVSVICADKTGTLTEGKLKVVKAVTGLNSKFEARNSKEEWLVKAALLCNDLRDPLEVAMMEWALRLPLDKLGIAQGKLHNLEEFKELYPRVDEIPFSHKSKYIATLHSQRTKNKEQRTKILFLSGAPEVVLAKSKVKSTKYEEWLKKFGELGSQGYRLVAFAYQEFENLKIGKLENSNLKDLQWLGVLAYEDPVREGVKEALRECQQAGIRVKVITGDYPATALAVLKKIDIQNNLVEDGIRLNNPKLERYLEDRVLTGEELEKMKDEELAQVIGKIVLFARTNPEQKLKIVRVLKQSGETVAMMGDGVNDAPALVQADIGIVVGGASDVAKETADLVLLDSNFATILAAVEGGRNIFANIKKVTVYLLSDCLMEVVIIGGALISGLPLPITATQILWIKLIEDVFPGVALALEPGEKEIMDEPPRSKKIPFWDSELKRLIFSIGFFSNIILLTYYWLVIKFFEPVYQQTLIFTALTISSLLIIFSCRSLKKPFWKSSFLANRYLILSVAFGVFLLILAVYWPPLQQILKTKPLSWQGWLSVIILGIFTLFVMETSKWIFSLKINKIKI